MGGVRPFERRSFLRAVAGDAGAAAPGAVVPGVVPAGTHDDDTVQATRDRLRAVPFYARNQSRITTAPHTPPGYS
ncbi:MAG: hypothetical protein JWR37_1751 [Mycobacterium sp.]|jgi:hypothetical protein|nr:hypothetical protein [Mycobacterium sp.]